MRIRTIKPEYWTDEKIGELSITARLLFLSLLNQSDDAGNLLCSLKQIKIHSFPYDDFDNLFIRDLLLECVKQDLLRLYTINGKSYLHITNFMKHQKINRPSPPQHPSFIDNSLNGHILLSDNSQRKEGRKEGKERKGKENEEEEEEENISFDFIQNLFDKMNSDGAKEFYDKMNALGWKSKGEKIKDPIAFTLTHIDNLKGIRNEKHERVVTRNIHKSPTTRETVLTRAEQRKIEKQRATGTEHR